MALVNGHSYKDTKSTNTNLAILVSHNFTYPFKKPIEYGRNVAKNLNELGTYLNKLPITSIILNNDKIKENLAKLKALER